MKSDLIVRKNYPRFNHWFYYLRSLDIARHIYIYLQQYETRQDNTEWRENPSPRREFESTMSYILCENVVIVVTFYYIIVIDLRKLFVSFIYFILCHIL